MTNSDIVSDNLDLIETCCSFGITKYKAHATLKHDLVQEVCLILLEMDNDKLNKIVFDDKHFNAYITGTIRNMLFSKTSRFYNTFRKFQDRTEELPFDSTEDPYED